MVFFVWLHTVSHFVMDLSTTDHACCLVEFRVVCDCSGKNHRVFFALGVKWKLKVDRIDDLWLHSSIKSCDSVVFLSDMSLGSKFTYLNWMSGLKRENQSPKAKLKLLSWKMEWTQSWIRLDMSIQLQFHTDLHSFMDVTEAGAKRNQTD